MSERLNRVEGAKARIETCAREMGYVLSDTEITTFAIIQVALADDALALAKEKLGSNPPASFAAGSESTSTFKATDADLPKNLWPERKGDTSNESKKH